MIFEERVLYIWDIQGNSLVVPLINFRLLDYAQMKLRIFHFYGS